MSLEMIAIVINGLLGICYGSAVTLVTVLYGALGKEAPQIFASFFIALSVLAILYNLIIIYRYFKNNKNARGPILALIGHGLFFCFPLLGIVSLILCFISVFMMLISENKISLHFKN